MQDMKMWLPHTQTSLSLDEDVRAKEGGKETSPAVCTLPMVPCGSSPVTRLYLTKNEAPEEEAGDVKYGTQDFNMQDMEMWNMGCTSKKEQFGEIISDLLIK